MTLYRSFATTLSQLKIFDFSGETFKGFEMLLSAMSATTTHLLFSGEFCKLGYGTLSIQSASPNFSFHTNNSKNAKFWVVTLLLQMRDIILHRNTVTNATVLPCWFTEKEFSGIASRNISVALL